MHLTMGMNGILILRLLVGSICGFVIGYERQANFKDAGIKTHMIVGFSASLVMIVSKYGFEDSFNYDAARIAAQLISGIGFLGAGIIYKRNFHINGLTTAAGILATAAIGLAIGSGLYVVGIAATLCLLVLRMIAQRTERTLKTMQQSYRIVLKNQEDMEVIHDLCNGYYVLSYKVEKMEELQVAIEATIVFSNEAQIELFTSRIMKRDDLVSFELY